MPDPPPMTRPPWNLDQVASLNEFQHSGAFHPFTCGECRDADPACPLVDQHLLVATEAGWMCPTCSYEQKWAWLFMANESWRNMLVPNALEAAKRRHPSRAAPPAGQP